MRLTPALEHSSFNCSFAYSEPVIIRGIDNSKFARASTRERLLNDYGHINVLLASGNTYSYKKRLFDLSLFTNTLFSFAVPYTFAEYVTGHLRPQDKANRGNGRRMILYCSHVDPCAETYFLFGDIDRSEWKPLLDLYDQPSKYIPNEFVSELSFGVAGLL